MQYTVNEEVVLETFSHCNLTQVFVCSDMNE